MIDQDLFDKAKDLFPKVPDNILITGIEQVIKEHKHLSKEQLLGLYPILKKRLETSYYARQFIKAKRKLKE